MEPDPNKCNTTYIPTSDQYFEALGSFSSSILIIGGLITLGLFILFFEQFVYTNQTAHHGAKRHIYWIASVYPMMTLMSLVALLIPRAHNVCLSVKMVYMSMGISHFSDLTVVMFGGEELLVERAREDSFNLRSKPLCCCCRCLPRPPVTKYSLRLIILLTDQLPFVQAFYYVTVAVLLSADNITLGNVMPSEPFLWLNLVRLTSAMSGVYGFTILSRFSRGYLDDFQYWKKSRSINLLLVITSFQSMIFNIMANYGAFPCLPPNVSPAVYKQTVDNSLYLLEMMILGPYTFWQYHDQHFATPITALPFYSRSSRSPSISSTHGTKDQHSTTATISTIVTAAGSSDTFDNDSDSDDGSSSIRTRPDDVESETARSSSTTAPLSSNNSSRGSRSHSSRNSRRSDSAFASYDSARESARDSASSNSGRHKSRKESSARSKTHNSRENSSRKSRKSNREEDSEIIRGKNASSRSTRNSTQPSTTSREDGGAAVSGGGGGGGGGTQDSTRERSASPTTTANSASSDSTTTSTSAPPSLPLHSQGQGGVGGVE